MFRCSHVGGKVERYNGRSENLKVISSMVTQAYLYTVGDIRMEFD